LKSSFYNGFGLCWIILETSTSLNAIGLLKLASKLKKKREEEREREKEKEMREREKQKKKKKKR
jgi:uncharacterized ion transporter superfamily protein YfcC